MKKPCWFFIWLQNSIHKIYTNIQYFWKNHHYQITKALKKGFDISYCILILALYAMFVCGVAIMAGIIICGVDAKTSTQLKAGFCILSMITAAAIVTAFIETLFKWAKYQYLCARVYNHIKNRSMR